MLNKEIGMAGGGGGAGIYKGPDLPPTTLVDMTRPETRHRPVQVVLWPSPPHFHP